MANETNSNRVSVPAVPADPAKAAQIFWRTPGGIEAFLISFRASVLREAARRFPESQTFPGGPQRWLERLAELPPSPTEEEAK